MRLIKLYPFTLLLLMLMFVNCKPKVRYGHNTAAGKYYPVNGIKLYTETYGTGKPLLMLHGNGGNMSAFAETVPFFSRNYRVILVDSRAQGQSADDGAKLTFEQMADDFAALLDTMHIARAYILGWSDGGINALEMAMRHPQKVIRLASTGANLWPDATAINPNDWKQGLKYFNEHKNTIWKTPKEKNDWKIFMLDWTQPDIKAEELKKITCPALIIAGEHDIIVDAHTRLIQKNIPGSRLWIVPNSGHATLIEHSYAFNKKVADFFEE